MGHFESVEEVLDFAIAREIEARDFYMKLAERMENPAMQKVFENFHYNLGSTKYGHLAILS